MSTTAPSSLRRTFLLGLTNQVVPAAFAAFIALYLLPKTTFPYTLAIVLSIAWGAIGAAIYYLGIKRGPKFRWGMTAVHALLTVGLCVGLSQAFAISHSTRVGCPVCGFASLEGAGDSCTVCERRFRPQDAADEGFASADEYLRAEQIQYFMPSPPDTAIDFFGPCNCKGDFHKDPAWQPATTRAEIREVQALAQ